jgi:hypothetical protein
MARRRDTGRPATGSVRQRPRVDGPAGAVDGPEAEGALEVDQVVPLGASISSHQARAWRSIPASQRRSPPSASRSSDPALRSTSIRVPVSDQAGAPFLWAAPGGPPRTAPQERLAASSSASARAIAASITAYSAESTTYAAHEIMSAPQNDRESRPGTVRGSARPHQVRVLVVGACPLRCGSSSAPLI